MIRCEIFEITTVKDVEGTFVLYLELPIMPAQGQPFELWDRGKLLETYWPVGFKWKVDRGYGGANDTVTLHLNVTRDPAALAREASALQSLVAPAPELVGLPPGSRVMRRPN
jgi:hypothetical protein